jgi:hypothetical protein
MVLDGVLTNPAVERYPLEEIEVPTLIIHSADDTLAHYETAAGAAARIPGVRFVTERPGAPIPYVVCYLGSRSSAWGVGRWNAFRRPRRPAAPREPVDTRYHSRGSRRSRKSVTRLAAGGSRFASATST